MRRSLTFVSAISVSVAALTACTPAVPDSGAGVGFQSYADYQRQREAELISNGQGQGQSAISGLNTQAISPEVPATSAGPVDETLELADDALAAIGASAPQAPADLQAPADPTGQFAAQSAPVENTGGISAENDFDVVSSERSIAQDAERVRANSAAYQVIQPSAVLARPEGATTSLVEFALSTSNSVGQPIYSRLTLGAEGRAARNCDKYPSPDLAQEAFLAGGGPARNVQGLDPDGDGFACSWNPSAFRSAVR
jgi:hypothetical protein